MIVSIIMSSCVRDKIIYDSKNEAVDLFDTFSSDSFGYDNIENLNPKELCLLTLLYFKLNDSERFYYLFNRLLELDDAESYMIQLTDSSVIWKELSHYHSYLRMMEDMGRFPPIKLKTDSILLEYMRLTHGIDTVKLENSSKKIYGKINMPVSYCNFVHPSVGYDYTIQYDSTSFIAHSEVKYVHLVPDGLSPEEASQAMIGNDNGSKIYTLYPLKTGQYNIIVTHKFRGDTLEEKIFNVDIRH